MSSRLLPAAVLLLGLACSDTVLYRAGEDYFPLVPGSTWKYLRVPDTIYVTVDTVDAAVNGRACRTVYRNFAPEYWVRNAASVEKFFVRVDGRPNTEDTLEARFGLVYSLPLVTGASWQETFRDTIVIRGTDTVRYEHTIRGSVGNVDSVTTPAGTFYDCYRVELTERIAARSAESTLTTVWLAPGVGVVRRLAGIEEEVLVEYQRGR